MSEHVAHQMARGNEFQKRKETFRTDTSIPVAKIAVPGLRVELREKVELPRFVGLFYYLTVGATTDNLKEKDFRLCLTRRFNAFLNLLTTGLD